jgi:chromosome partitioning protein
MSLTERIKNMIQAELSPQKKESSGKNSRAKVIAICSQKGGVGKTTTAVNLGAALAKFHGKKVLIADLDPQGHVEKSLGTVVTEGVDYTPLSRVLTAKRGEFMDAVVKTEDELLHITPGDKTLYETEGTLTAKIGREYILTNSLQAARGHYDVIILDCPPNLGNLTINALCASDYVVIPCEMSVLAFEGVTDLLGTLDTVTERLNPSLKVLGVLFTRVDGRNITMNKLIEENMGKHFKGRIFRSRIGVNTDLNKAQLEGVPVFDYAPSSTGSSHYKDLSAEIAKRLIPKNRRKPLESSSN